MNTNDYNEKLQSLLNDDNNYSQSNEQAVNTDTQVFNKTIKKCLRNENKTWTRLIEYHLTISTLYGFSQKHKKPTYLLYPASTVYPTF